MHRSLNRSAEIRMRRDEEDVVNDPTCRWLCAMVADPLDVQECAIDVIASARNAGGWLSPLVKSSRLDR